MKYQVLICVLVLALSASAYAQDEDGIQIRVRIMEGDDSSPFGGMMGQDQPSFFRRLSLPLLMRNMFARQEEQAQPQQQEEAEEPSEFRVIRIISSDDEQPQEEMNPLATVSRMFMRLRGLINAVQENNIGMMQQEDEGRRSSACPLRRACQEDVERLCADAEGVAGAVPACLKANIDKVSPLCGGMLKRFLGDTDDEEQGGAQEQENSEEEQESSYASQSSDDSETVPSTSTEEESSAEAQPEAQPVQEIHGPCAEDAVSKCAGVTEKRAVLQCLLHSEMTAHDLSPKCHSLLAPLLGHEGRSVRRNVPQGDVKEIAKHADTAPAPTVQANSSPIAQLPLVPLLIGAAAFTVMGVIVVLVQRRRARRRALQADRVVVQLANPSAQISVADEHA